MLASARSAVLLGVDGHAVAVEVHVSRGIPGYTVVGLPDAATRESRERVRAAMLSSGLAFPNARITVNLAPASLRKSGSGLEVAIAVALLVADEALPAEVLTGAGLVGELGLDGRVRPVAGVLAMVDALARSGVAEVIVPAENAAEAGLVPGVLVRAARGLAELHCCLRGELPWPDPPEAPAPAEPAGGEFDLGEVRGLTTERRALAAAAAGGHHLLLVGPPGAGKTMLARRLPTILPELEPDAAVEVTRIHSAAGHRCEGRLLTAPPFRAPHHTASAVALVGGGSPRPRPGEITLAHRGILFLDEVAEFPPGVLDALRQPLEEGVVHISRAAVSLRFPAQFLLVACCNPCPCGRAEEACRCSDVQRARYFRRLSAPLLDRFDLRLFVHPPGAAQGNGPPSASVREQVAVALERQRARYRDTPWRRNADVPASALARVAPLSARAHGAWREQCETHRFSGRGATRLWRVARTLADLDDVAEVGDAHVEAAAWMRQDVLR